MVKIKAGYVWIVSAMAWQDSEMTTHRNRVSVVSKAFDEENKAVEFLDKYDGYTEIGGFDTEWDMEKKLVPLSQMEMFIEENTDLEDLEEDED